MANLTLSKGSFVNKSFPRKQYSVNLLEFENIEIMVIVSFKEILSIFQDRQGFNHLVRLLLSFHSFRQYIIVSVINALSIRSFVG